MGNKNRIGNNSSVSAPTSTPRRRAFAEALKVSMPLMAGYLFLSIGYGIYMTGQGFSPFWPICMAATIYAGSMEFITAALLLGTFNPLYALLLTIAINGRHIFYTISLLGKYRKTGWKQLPLVSGLTDEAFSLIYISQPKQGIPHDWYMLFVTGLLYVSWIVGATLGAFAGNWGFADIKGVEFVMPALFIVIFVSQWQKEQSHASSLIGFVVAVACLPMFGERYFMLAALLIVAAGYSIKWIVSDKRKETAA